MGHPAAAAACREIVTIHCLQAGLLGMQDQRYPVGVTAAPELRPPDKEPYKHGRCRRDISMGQGVCWRKIPVPLDPFSKRHKTLLLGPSFEPTPAHA